MSAICCSGALLLVIGLFRKSFLSLVEVDVENKMLLEEAESERKEVMGEKRFHGYVLPLLLVDNEAELNLFPKLKVLNS